MEPFYAHFFLWFVYNHVKTSPHLRLLFSRTPQRRFAAKLQKRNDKPSLEFDMFCDAWEWADNDFWMNCSFKVMTEFETTVYTALNTPLKSFRRSNCLLFFYSLRHIYQLYARQQTSKMPLGCTRRPQSSRSRCTNWTEEATCVLFIQRWCV